MKILTALLLLPALASAECQWLSNDFCMDELPAFTEYCKGGSALCHPAMPTNHKLTYAELQAVNDEVNSEIYWESDPDNIYRRPLNGYGDCEDFAIEKAERLISLGWTSNSLRLAGVNKNHMVLLAMVGNDTYVLDSQYQYATKVEDDVRYYDMLQITGTKFWEIRE